MQYFTPHPLNLPMVSRGRFAVEQPLLQAAIDTVDTVRELQTRSLTTGFDAARAQYAAGVQAGLFERSLLASAAFERRLALLERLLLGPWARSV